MPIRVTTLTFEVTKRCNKQCTFCSARCTPSREQPELTLAQFDGYLRQASDLEITKIGQTGGNIFLHPNFRALSKRVHTLGFDQNSLSINSWTQGEKGKRVTTLRKIYHLLSKRTHISPQVAVETRGGHHTEIEFFLTLSPLMLGGDEAKVLRSWHATFDGLTELAPLIGQKKIRCTYRDDGTAMRKYIRTRQLPSLLTSVVKNRDPEVAWLGQTEALLSLRDELHFELDFQGFSLLGRAADSGLQPLEPIRTSRCPLEIFRRKTPGVFDPLITATGHLHPCCVAAIDAKPPEEIALRVVPDEPGSLLRAFEWYQQNEPHYFAQAREIYESMEENADFCQACIQARLPMIRDGQPIAS